MARMTGGDAELRALLRRAGLEVVGHGKANGARPAAVAWRPVISGGVVPPVAVADLPPIRLHGLRHGAATHALAAGVDARVVKETLGHSSSTFTRDTYQSVVDEVKHQAAAALAGVFNRAGARVWSGRQEG